MPTLQAEQKIGIDLIREELDRLGINADAISDEFIVTAAVQVLRQNIEDESWQLPSNS